MRVASCSCHSGACSHIVAPDSGAAEGGNPAQVMKLFSIMSACLVPRSPLVAIIFCAPNKKQSQHISISISITIDSPPPSPLSPRRAFATVFRRKMCAACRYLASIMAANIFLTSLPVRPSVCPSVSVSPCILSGLAYPVIAGTC